MRGLLGEGGWVGAVALFLSLVGGMIWFATEGRGLLKFGPRWWLFQNRLARRKARRAEREDHSG